MMSARNDPMAPNEYGSDGWIRACFSQPLFRLNQGGPHKFLVGTLLRHELKVSDQPH
jgi:hypothetical protein